MFTAIGFQVKLQLKMCIKLHHSTHTQRGLNKCLSDKLTCLRSPRNVHGVCLHLQAKRQTCGVHIRCPEQPLSGPWVLSHHLPVPITTPHTKQMKLKPSSEKCFKIGTVFIIKNPPYCHVHEAKRYQLHSLNLKSATHQRDWYTSDEPQGLNSNNALFQNLLQSPSAVLYGLFMWVFM